MTPADPPAASHMHLHPPAARGRRRRSEIPERTSAALAGRHHEVTAAHCRLAALPSTEPVLAIDVEAGDVLLTDDGELTVTAPPQQGTYQAGGSFAQRGDRVAGRNYLADFDTRLSQRRFGAVPAAQELRGQIAAFTAAADPAVATIGTVPL